MTVEDESGEKGDHLNHFTEKDEPPYQITPQEPLGAIIRGLKLTNQLIPKSTIDRLKADVYKYHLLIVKDQGVLEADDQIRVSEWFGEIDTTGQCPVCRNLQILCLSNTWLNTKAVFYFNLIDRNRLLRITPG